MHAARRSISLARRRGSTRVGTVSSTTRRAGTVTLTLKATGKGRSRLRRAGKLAISVRLTFTPAGGKAGAPVTRKATLRYSP